MPGSTLLRNDSQEPRSLNVKSSVLEVRQIAEHHRGVFAKKEIPENVFICWYEGTVYKQSQKSGDYTLYVGGGYSVDGETSTCIAKFINAVPQNHVANVAFALDETKELLQTEFDAPYVITTKPIAEGEQLLVYYGKHFSLDRWFLHEIL